MTNLNHAKSWDLIAHDYNTEIISPFIHATYFPLQKVLKAIKNISNFHVADFGTGTGILLPKIHQHFKKITAIDFSSQMLTLAEKRIAALPNLNKNQISFLKTDLTKKTFSNKNRFDLAFSINSMVEPDAIKSDQIFSNILSSLKGPKIFIGVFPAIEAIFEEYHYSYSKLRKQKYSHSKAKQLVDSSLEIERLDPLLGTYQADELTQKYFTQEEIDSKLQRFGINNIVFEKVIYQRQFSFNLKAKTLRNHPYMWDWFVYARQ